ncbi:ABC transporter ATP-binding protein [Bacillus sonorensis]|uniref:ABC transporter ATP-binding protein n=1 Tax=Bacillus sonorensis TaxID=119858 RepID=UPI0004950437|nr:sn-glycerol-3-phosphate ABC transporter ATP-binding protein UgpC [Bacillus sonorensis]MCF7616699.1 sn-glycerol-3-phosphate ABC transporter ATP-binding protein UgpC [Bacillus sonorensis]MCY7857376.1 sn-glycerol-3-phosphate ABC transporter ATP-binding protein UgpC [Bacillus sonorensis]MCY8033747.1 sn-glycerol-3-phosphate ABC transporter ATP-binding protein UgpC [Bacillus sonorensis]MCY8271359.1 sn-glycerol-3-phosphate ABC transporter ATP-binding protein UgpC [Bacillus sonorensis]MCY8403274.1 
MASLTFHHVHKKYGTDHHALKDFHLEVRDQEFLVIVGPSGCGKSTALRMTAGLEKVTEGELYLGNELINHVPPKDRDIAMVFQNYALYPHMTVFDNMAFGLKLRKLSKREIEKRVHEAAEILEIGHLLKRKPKALSGGQRQRVALGRSIVREPQVFLMDEPLSNLDAKLRTAMRTEISKLHQRLKTTVIYVTHDQTEAMTMADRIVVMYNGEIQQVASPHDIYHHPANQFVAGFIGSPGINFFKGIIEEQNGELFFANSSIRLHIPKEKSGVLQRKGYLRKEAVLGIRPEHVNEQGQREETSFQAQVELSENMGSEQFLHAAIGEAPLIARLDGAKNLSPGEEISLSVNMEHAVFFDPHTEAAI